MCYQPITIKTPQGYRTVPCGKCLECLRKYQSDWSNRMYEELKSHDGKAVFFTLTYDEENVPKNYLYYYDSSTYEIFRSPSDYGYDNTYIDEKGREKVLPRCKGERKHRRISPSIELQSLGEENTIIDFNIKRKEQLKFRDQIQDIYGNYLRTLSVNFDSLNSDYQTNIDCPDEYWDFDSWDSSDMLDAESMEEDFGMACDIFTEALNDDDFQDEISSMALADKLPGEDTISYCERISPSFRKRPVMMFNSVRKKDVQDWIKRGRSRRRRKAIKTGEPEQEFTFFVTSEYGPRTLRPHYHGVLFGVTAEEAYDMCVDWQRHHGRKISWADVDLSKGDMSYCAKYCSKGFFEHPLCSRDFFYHKPSVADDGTVIRPFTEYHSKHYERCLEIFNIDAPIVDPTFHLVSKGLGIDWVAHHQDLISDFNDIDFIDSGTSSMKFVKELMPWDSDFDKDAQGPYTHIIRINNKEKTKDYDECIRKLFERFHYYRSFKNTTVAYGVPKYYRTKIFSDGLRCAFTNFVQCFNAEVYQEKFEQLRAEFPTWQDSQVVHEFERREIEEKLNRINSCYKRYERIYDKSKL